MGQYHYLVNLDKREFINPHKLAVGLKACEQLGSFPSTPQALFVLPICSNGRGGGDLAETRGFGERTMGRWVGDRIAVVGDYAEDTDIRAPLHDPVSAIYDLCYEGRYREISDLLRPVLAPELGVEFIVEPKVFLNGDGSEERYESWRVQRAVPSRAAPSQLRRVYAPEPDTLTVDLEGIAAGNHYVGSPGRSRYNI